MLELLPILEPARPQNAASVISDIAALVIAGGAKALPKRLGAGPRFERAGADQARIATSAQENVMVLDTFARRWRMKHSYNSRTPPSLSTPPPIAS